MSNSQITISCKTSNIDFSKTYMPNTNPLGIKLFKIKISDYISYIPKLKIHLSGLESERAIRYYHERDSLRFIICRGLLKFILAKETSLDVSAIKIELGKNKKPYLQSHPKLHFNVSHSKNYALIAIANNPIGVDVEFVSTEFNFDDILHTIFSAKEIIEVQKATNKKEFLYKLWTRKEAIVKATGKGISDYISKTPVLDGLHVLKSNILNLKTNLQVISFDIDENYIGSVAFFGEENNPDKVQFYPIPYLTF